LFETSFAYTDASVPGSVISGTYSASATAEYGRLRASIHSEQSGTGNPGRSVPLIAVYTYGAFHDTVTILENPYLLTPGFFFMAFALTGSGAGVDSEVYEGVHSETWGGFSAGMEGTSQTIHYLDTTNKTISVNPVYSDPVFFTPGVPVSISALLSPALSISCNTGPVGSPCDDWSGWATSYFGSTATLVGIEVYDSAGEPVPEFSILSESGTHYTSRGVVAEPSTVLLVVAGLAACVRRRRLRQSV
jgi:hypothetical protein